MPPDRGPSEQAVVFTLGFEDEATKQLDTAVDSFEMAENDIGKAVVASGRSLDTFDSNLQDIGKAVTETAATFTSATTTIQADYGKLSNLDDVEFAISVDKDEMDSLGGQTFTGGVPSDGLDMRDTIISAEKFEAELAAARETAAGIQVDAVNVDSAEEDIRALKRKFQAAKFFDQSIVSDFESMMTEAMQVVIAEGWDGSVKDLRKSFEDLSIFASEEYGDKIKEFYDDYAQRHPEATKFMNEMAEEWGKDFSKETEKGLQKAMDNVEERGFMSGAMEGAAGAMGRAGESIKGVFSGAATKILGVIGLMTLAMKVLEPVMEILEDAIMPLIVPIQDALVQIVEALRPLFNALNPVINELLGKLLPPIIKIIESLIPVVTSLLDALMPIIDILMFGLMPIIAQLAPMILDLLLPVLDLLLYPLKMIASLFGDVEESVDSAGDSAMNFGSIIFDWMLMPMKVFWDFVSFIFSPDKWVALINDPIGFAIDTLMGWMPSWLKWLLGIDDTAPNEASGEDLINTFGEGIEAAEPTLEQIVDSTLEQGVGEQLPSSDADRGPLSDLSGAGAATIETFGKGMEEEQGFLDSIFSSLFSPFSLLFGLPGMAFGAINEMVKTPKLKPEVPQVDMSSKGESFSDSLKPIIVAIEEGSVMIVNAIKEQGQKKPPADAGIGVNPGYRNLAEFRL